MTKVVASDGRAIDALRQREFRRVYVGAFCSNVGTWMQNVVLGALAYDLTESSAFVAIVFFAQLGPMLLFSIIGGLLADSVDRRHLLLIVLASQAALSVALAGVAGGSDPNRVGIVVIVFFIGVGQSVFGPTYSAVLPDLVRPENLAGAISLNSTQINGSRIIGPAIGGLLFVRYGASWVFLTNAATYVVVMAVLATSTLPAVEGLDRRAPLRARLSSGFSIARQRRPIGRALVLMAGFSMFCLPFIGHMPTIASRNLGIDVRSATYGWLYATFGLGAMLGALAVGTVLTGLRKAMVVRWGFAAFALTLGTFSWLRDPAPAFVFIGLVGFAYFATVTSMSTVVQMNLAGHERGRVMALWMMTFAGTVPLGTLIAGPAMDATSATTVVFPGAILAMALAWFARLEREADALVPAPPYLYYDGD